MKWYRKHCNPKLKIKAMADGGLLYPCENHSGNDRIARRSLDPRALDEGPRELSRTRRASAAASSDSACTRSGGWIGQALFLWKKWRGTLDWSADDGSDFPGGDSCAGHHPSSTCPGERRGLLCLRSRRREHCCSQPTRPCLASSKLMLLRAEARADLIRGHRRRGAARCADVDSRTSGRGRWSPGNVDRHRPRLRVIAIDAPPWPAARGFSVRGRSDRASSIAPAASPRPVSARG